jgi:hypothetical protein
MEGTMAEGVLAFRSLTLDPGVWTPVYPPFPCDNVTVNNLLGTDTLRIRRDGVVITVAAGKEQPLSAFVRRHRLRFIPEECAFELQPVSGTGPVTLIWT